MGQLQGAKRPDGRRFFFARALVRALPVLLVLGGLCYDHFMPRVLTAVPFFTAAPLVAAPLLSLAGTVVTGAASIGGILAVRLRYSSVGEADTLTEISTVATVAVLAVAINRLVRRSDARLATAREIAEAAQRAVLPRPQERIGGLEIAARYEAAQAGASIGGDLYAVQDSPHGVRLIVGDVRGKGLGAVAAVAVLIGAFREAAEQESTLEAVAQRLERALAREVTRRDAARRDPTVPHEGFVTALLAEFPHGAGLARIVNRGHPAPLLLHADGALWTLDTPWAALPLGLDELGTWPDRAEEVAFPAGATLLFYTDGLSEARNADGVFYDPAARLRGRTFPAPRALLTMLAEEVREHTGGGTTDDMALLAVRRP
ncbi:PP2C family protein-serine/threonine phosphatase [Streptomyces sp. MA5143a]|uniref:PP2C family protein-serine/threonine phosphatase n=1 Tax=Streptomyces sp. MA5143a TaxID=2083010 RepID=UPI000D2D2603|nr:PP2C family protein-serine/threonine phosphatase [Streptomyces sp. MA5143a]SPF01928.1 Stage II sporulation protein E (SpoIIE) [Streptomyces sp. MA5143a]